MNTGNGLKRERLDRKKKSGFEGGTTKALVDMKAEEADQMIEAQMLTFAAFRRILDNCKSDDLSNTCYFHSKSDVCEMILFAINGKRGVVKPGTVLAKFVKWGLVEFAPDLEQTNNY